MGSPSTEVRRENDSGREDLHQEVLTKDFYVGCYEVTQYQCSRRWGTRVGAVVLSLNDYKACVCGAGVVLRHSESVGATTRGNWPSNDTVRGVVHGDALRTACGFDLPRRTRSESSCRARTTGH
jgi:hypothetical protein